MKHAFFAALFTCTLCVAQPPIPEGCDLIKSAHTDFYTVNAEQVRCLARQSEKDITLFTPYVTLCAGCKYGLPTILELSKRLDVDVYVLSMDEDNVYGKYLINEMAVVLDTMLHNEMKAVIISDSLYRPETRKKLDRSIRKYVYFFNNKSLEKYYTLLNSFDPTGKTSEKMNIFGGGLLVFDRHGRFVGSGYATDREAEDPVERYADMAALIKEAREKLKEKEL